MIGVSKTDAKEAWSEYDRLGVTVPRSCEGLELWRLPLLPARSNPLKPTRGLFESAGARRVLVNQLHFYHVPGHYKGAVHCRPRL